MWLLQLAYALKQEAEHLWHEATQLEVEGFQWIESALAGSGAEVLYDIIWSSLADPDLSYSMGPPLPKRQRWAAMATVASTTAQEPEDITPRPEIGTSLSREEIPAEMEPLGINMGNIRWVYHCHAGGCTEGP